MKRPFVAALVLGIFATAIAEAQLGRLKGKLKEVVRDSGGQVDADKGEPGTGGPGKLGTGTRPGVKKDASRQYPPGISYSSLLNNVLLVPKDGQFRLNHIQGTFIPDDCEGGCIVLRKAGGSELCQFDWKPDRLKKPYCILAIHTVTDLQSGQTLPASYDLKTPGDYVLDFYLPDEHFYTFPFSVRKVGSSDPFGDGDAYVLDGDWQKYGYLFYSDAKPDQSLNWKVWLRSGTAGTLDGKVFVEIKRDADGTLICTSREGTSHRIKPDWVRYEFDTVFPEGRTAPRGTYFKAKDLLETDGAYTLTMTINGEKYGDWKFEVEGGLLKHKGRAVRGEVDALTFIEGGRDAWWYAKE